MKKSTLKLIVISMLIAVYATPTNSIEWGTKKCAYDCSEKACSSDLKFANQCITNCTRYVTSCKRGAVKTIQDSKFDEAIENKKRQCNETYDEIRAGLGRRSNGIDPGGSIYYNYRLAMSERYRQNCIIDAVNTPSAAPTSTPTPTNSSDGEGSQAKAVQ